MVVIALTAVANCASPVAVGVTFGTGFWRPITFTMQMAFVAIGACVVTSAPTQRLIGAA
jgi:short subunit fatty acids transporter